MDFAEAVDFAADKLSVIQQLPTEADKLAAVIVHWSNEGDMGALATVVDAARSQALSRQALRLAGAELIRRGAPLPPVLATWLMDELKSNRKPPKTPPGFRRGWPGEKLERNLLLHAVVVSLREQGIAPTRNDEAPAVSGCDAVSKAIRRLGLKPLSFKHLKEIYGEIEAQYRTGRDPGIGVAVISQLIKDTRHP